MRKWIFLILVLTVTACTTNKEDKEERFITLFETSNGMETPEYAEVMDFYKDLERSYPEIQLQAMGETDSGLPLHIVTFNADGMFNFEDIREDKAIIFINNGIHPGESDGIDATMLLFRDLAQQKIAVPKNTVIVAIPVYNIGGALNRNSGSRANQNGPEMYGFRGNARNYDLNRDFIKSDTKNAHAFAAIFHLIRPDVFIDNHVSNGADYQYTLTHLFTQHNKLGGVLGNYMHTELMPKLEASLAEKNWDITPYVNVFNRTPDAGFSQFMDYPRYSTGYTTLWNTLGLMVETHMLKPYKDRVEGTYELMKSMIAIVEREGVKLKALRAESHKAFTEAKTYPVQWVLDTTKTSSLLFKGYEGEYKTSEITGMRHLYYDRSAPFTKEVTYRNYYKPGVEITIPRAYIIPQGWWDVIKLLKANRVQMKMLEKDTAITVEVYKIESYETASSAYEGHYLHYNTKVAVTKESILFKKGDYMVETLQPSFRYILETLEPQAPDSFFNWNFFDTVLQQKEGFSPYVFEATAQKMLESDDALRAAFEAKKENDSAFSGNWFAQLNWLYKKSVHYEKAHLRYPVYRIPKAQ